MTHCDTPVILDISLWERPRPDNWAISLIITGWMLVGMIVTLVGIQRQLSTECDQPKRATPPLGSLRWRHNELDGVSDHQPHVYSGADQRKHQSSASLAFVRGNSQGTGEFPAQMASNAENVFIWWRHHVNWWNRHSRKRRLTGTGQKWRSTAKVSDSLERSFRYCQGPYIDIDIDFQQLWGKTWGKCMYIVAFCT